jgi:mannopine transport system permease protein
MNGDSKVDPVRTERQQPAFVASSRKSSGTPFQAFDQKAFRRIDRKEKAVTLAFLVPCVLFLALFFFLPVASFLVRGFFDPEFTLHNYVRAVSGEVYLVILWRTIVTSFLTSLLCLLLGYPVAYVVAHASSRTQAVVLAFVLIPFWTSILVRVFAWIALLGRNGVINSALMKVGITNAPIPMLYNDFAVLLSMTHVMLPYMILPCFSVMKNISPTLTAAAENLGASPWRAFLRVYFPLSLQGAAAGCLLVFIISGGFYITPALLGGANGIFLSQLIEQEVNSSVDWSFASALSGILVLVTVSFYVLYERFVAFDDNLGEVQP